MQQELELSRLQPQEIGISIVDTAVSLETTKSTGFLGFPGTVAMGGVAGLLLGILGVLFRAQLDRALNTRDRLQRWTGLSCLGAVPRLRKARNPHLPLASKTSPSPFSESIQLLGAELQAAVQKGSRSVLVTSRSAGEGKTTVALNLAQVLGQYGHRVLLVDANLRKPDVARALDLGKPDGLSTALKEGRDPQDYILAADGFSVLPGGASEPYPMPLLSSPAMKAFLEQAGEQYDMVLVDGPPVRGFADTRVLAQQLGEALLVVKAGATDADAVNQVKEDLESIGASLLGAVLNFAQRDDCRHLKIDNYGPSKGRSGIARLLWRRKRNGKAGSATG